MIPTPYTTLVASLRAADGQWETTITEDWAQGRTTFGGLSAALCLEAARAQHQGLPTLRSALISFIGPALGPVRLSSRLLRAGRSVAFVEADLEAETGLATRAVFAFGAPRSSTFDRDFVPAPSAAPPDEGALYMPEGEGPAFLRHFEHKLVRGGRPASASSASDHLLWIRHKDRLAASESALLALADMPAPAVMPMFGHLAPASSMTWMVNFLASSFETEGGWWLVETRAENAKDGYSSQDMFVWSRAGVPVIAARQQVTIFI